MFKPTIKTTVETKPAGILIYSKSGLGKSSFLIDAVNDAENGILYQCGEDSLGDLGKEVPHDEYIIGSFSNEEEKIQGWSNFLEILKSYILEDHGYTCIAFDNLDNVINNNLTAFVLDTYYKNKDGSINTTEAYGWGGAYLKEAYSELATVIKGFEMLQNRGISIYVSCHGQTVRDKDPRNEDFKKWSLEIPVRDDYNLRNMLINWSSATLFGSLDVVVDSKTKKGSGSRHVLFSKQDAAWDAKCRYDIPDKFDFKYKTFKEFVIKSKES